MDRDQLGNFLRTRRERVRPEDIGLPAGRHRRTPGLRREEVAHLAGMSVDYYTRLEQARGPRPSRQVLSALSRALQLTDAEHAHLLHLAGESPLPPTGMSREVPVGVLRLLDRLDDAAGLVLSAARDVLAWNSLAAAVFGDLSVVPEAERNLVWMTFVGSPVQNCVQHVDRTEYARETAAELRAAAARYPADARLRTLIARLRQRSPDFAAVWDTHDVAGPTRCRKELVHVAVGRLDLEQEVLLIPEHDQRLVLLTAAPGSPSYEALQMLKVIGTQQMACASETRVPAADAGAAAR